MTPNADQQRTPLNTTTGAKSKEEVLYRVKEVLASVKTVRKNAILAVEYLITSSQDLDSVEESDQYLDAAEAWIRTKHGAENVVHATKHWDETTTHLSAIVVPIDPKGKLSASHFLDGRIRLSRMQTDFFKQVGEQFGLQRGIEGSTAKHTSIQEYYARINTDIQEPFTEIPRVLDPTPAEILAESLGHETEHSKAVAAAAAAKKKRDAEVAERQTIERAKAKQADLLRRQMKDQAAGVSRFRATAVVARDLKLEEVLERLGCQRDSVRKMNWRTQVGLIILDGTKFYSHSLGKGGTGAVDLVKMVEDTDYQGALRLLSEKFGSAEVLAEGIARAHETLKEQIAAAASAPVPAFQLPAQSIQNWPSVANYMTNVWKLSDALVESLHDTGKVYADQYSNVVFVLNGWIGVELHGTGEKPFHGFRGTRTEFEIQQGDVKRVAFVEDSVSAICLLELGFDGRIVSLSGKPASSAKELANNMCVDGYQVFAAFPNDRGGDSEAQSLGLDIERLRPKLQNWEKDLVANKKLPSRAQIPQQSHDETRNANPQEHWPRER